MFNNTQTSWAHDIITDCIPNLLRKQLKLVIFISSI